MVRQPSLRPAAHHPHLSPLTQYKDRFTEALWMEAQLVHELHEKGKAVYIFDSEAMKPAEVAINLQDGIKTMGSFSEWWGFCQSNHP